MERLVIAAYKPFPGMEQKLNELIKAHIQILGNESLVTERRPIIMQAADGTIIEVFGWKSKEAIESAHTNPTPTVLKMWDDFSKVCEYIPINQVPESLNLFSEFSPLH